MKKGGYQIADLKGINFSLNSPTPVEGFKDMIKNAKNKRIVVSGLNIAGTEYDDTEVEFRVSGSAYVGTLYGLNMNVTQDSMVIFTNVSVQKITGNTVSVDDFNTLLDVLAQVGIIKTN